MVNGEWVVPVCISLRSPRPQRETENGKWRVGSGRDGNQCEKILASMRDEVNREWSMVNGLLRFVFLCVPRALGVRRKMESRKWRVGSGRDGNQCKSVKSVRENP
jgi:hypothetical protein